MSLLLTGKGGRRFEWIAPIDPADVVFAGLGLWPENGDEYRNDAPIDYHATATGGLSWERTDALGRWQITGDGTGLVTFADSPALDVPSYTVAAWFTYHNSLRTYGWARDAGGVNRMNFIGRGSNVSAVYTAVWDSSGAIWEYNSPAGWIVVGVPIHVAITYRAGEQLVYLNGKQVGTTGTLANDARTGAAPVTLLGFTSTTYAVSVADPIMLSKAASPEQIAWLADPANRPVRPWRRRAFPAAVAEPSGFKPYWARNVNTLIGGGVS